MTVIDELRNCFFFFFLWTVWVKPLLLCKSDKPFVHRLISQSHSGLLFIRAITPVSCAAVPPGGPTAVQRSIHRLSVPSHRRLLPPCAATPALNGESPSGEEAHRL